jgi:hypothetical protein
MKEDDLNGHKSLAETLLGIGLVVRSNTKAHESQEKLSWHSTENMSRWGVTFGAYVSSIGRNILIVRCDPHVTCQRRTVCLLTVMISLGGVTSRGSISYQQETEVCLEVTKTMKYDRNNQ